MRRMIFLISQGAILLLTLLNQTLKLANKK